MNKNWYINHEIGNVIVQLVHPLTRKRYSILYCLAQELWWLGVWVTIGPAQSNYSHGSQILRRQQPFRLCVLPRTTKIR